MTRELAGYVDVDSGSIMIGDPCYLTDWETHENPDRTWKDDGLHFDSPEVVGLYSYYGSANATLSDKGYGQLNHAGGRGGAAVATSTAYGDGSYPVYIERNSEGRISKVIVDFEPEDDEQDEDGE